MRTLFIARRIAISDVRRELVLVLSNPIFDRVHVLVQERDCTGIFSGDYRL